MTILEDAKKHVLKEDGLPAFIYFENIMKTNIKYLLELTKGIPLRKCLYSVKAASSPFILATLYKNGIDGFDASSPTEGLMVRAILGRKAYISLTYPAMCNKDVGLLTEIRPNVINLDSLISLNNFLSSTENIPFGIRINPGIGYSEHSLYKAGGKQSRLGIPLKDLTKAFEICKKYNRTEFGLHFHISCQAQTFAYSTESLKKITEKIKNISSKFYAFTNLNLGGGIFPPSWDFNKDVIIPPKLNEQTVKILEKNVKYFLETNKNNLSESFNVFFEPGDFIIGSAAVLVAGIIEKRKDWLNKDHLILNTNISHFPNLLQYGYRPRIIHPQQKENGRKTILSGNSCFAGDVISTSSHSNREKPDCIIFDDRGSYEYSEYNFFNGRLRPKIYFHPSKGETTLMKADSINDLLSYWREENRKHPKDHEAFYKFEELAKEQSGLYLYHPDLKYLSSFELDPRAFPIPPSIKNNFIDKFEELSTIYGRSLGIDNSRGHIANYENLYIDLDRFYKSDNIVITLGAANAFWLVLHGFLKNTAKRVLIHCPSYYQFTIGSNNLKIPWKHIHKTDFKLDEKIKVNPWDIIPSYKDIVLSIKENPDLGAIVISNPGLPWGTSLPPSAIKKLAEQAKNEGWILILDETLSDLNLTVPDKSRWKWLDHSLPLIRVNSFSKTFGLSGLRFGYMSCTDSIKDTIDQGKKALDIIATQVDATCASPPSIAASVIEPATNILINHLRGTIDDDSKRQFRRNLLKLKERARWVSQSLMAYKIPHIVPEYSSSLMMLLTKLSPYPNNNFQFFRELLKKHKMFIELGGLFNQNPNWDFTISRIGLGRKDEDFEKDVTTFCEFYDKYRTYPEVK